MRITPEYGNNVIVGVNYHNSFSWYVADKDYWILDLEKEERIL